MKYVLNLLLLLGINQSLFADISLRFKSAIAPDAERLGDILTIRGETPQCRLGQIAITGKIKAGRELNRDALLAWLTRQRFCPAIKFIWLGKTRARVKRPVHSSGNDLVRLAQTALQQSWQQDFEKLELQPVAAPTGSSLPLSGFKIRLPAAIHSRAAVWLEQKQQALQIWFKVRAWKKVWVARRPLAAGETLKPEDFSRQTRNIAGLGQLPEKIPARSRLKNRLPEGTALTAAFVEPLPAVRSGHTVDVTVKEGSIRIHSMAIAMQDGRCRQNIRVKNARSQQWFRAVVIGENAVEVSA